MALQGSTPEGRRFLQACEMYETGLEMMRQRLRREHPGVPADEIESMLRAWVSDRPYDSPGHPVLLPPT